MSFTVTATQGGATENGMALVVKVLTGAAASQPGAVAEALSATPSLPITPADSGSWVYGAALASSTILSPLANTTNEQNSGLAGVGYIAFRSTAVTTGGTPATYGEGGSTHGIGIALAEIIAAGTLAEDASSPAPVAAAAVTTLTTAAFTPPAGALLVAVIAANGNVGTTTMALTDTSGLGLTWTEQSKANGSSSGYAGVWTAQVPAAASSGPNQAWWWPNDNGRRMRM